MLSKKTIYKAKISYGLLFFIFISLFAHFIPDIVHGAFNTSFIIVFGLICVVYFYIIYLFLNTNYTIENNNLIIKSGFSSYPPIGIDEITEITISREIKSAPAPSFDRIKIKYGENKSVLLSPKDKLSFANHLSRLNPRIKNLILPS